ncbi:NlpE-like protein [Nicoletella semolina]|uniref:NlpE-like protein n=1 Tax=Nicoletella semolina TaxID=271160 RepID=A0A4R2NCU7_9PAST|nr:copper resistance protein NlpE [Nicoletella semolina]MDH2924209.1 hypothetical protein [Nicoletella semolina]TCP18894.1 NlpE-like protein [Nicoletella semolina]
MKKFALLTGITLITGCATIMPSKTISGVYQGFLPCADCEHIQAELVLNKDNSYQYNTVYFLKNNKKQSFSEQGIFYRDSEKNNVIRLKETDNTALIVTEDYLEFADQNGNKIDNTNNYKLHKRAK